MEFVCEYSGFNFVLRFVTSALVIAPIIWQLAQAGFLPQARGTALRGFEFCFYSVSPGLCIGGTHVFGIDLPKPRMLGYRFVEQRLRYGWVVDLAVPVTAVPDHVYDDIAAECVAIFEGHATDSNYSINIFRVDVKNRNALPSRQLRRK